MTVVRTARLDLVPLSLPLVEAVLARDLARAAELAPYRVDGSTFAGDDHVLRLRRDQLRADPSQEPWLYRAAVSRASGEVLGRIGFHAPPDAAGTVEVGWSVAPPHRRQGLAVEMARGLLGWGARCGAARCLASVRPDNEPSLRTVARLGFVRTGEQVDEVDGLEWVFTLELAGSFPQTGPPR